MAAKYWVVTLRRWTTVAALVFLGWKFIPVYAAALRFNYAVYECARAGATFRQSEEEVQQRIVWQAERFRLPVGRENVAVHTESSEETQIVSAQVAYQVPIELLVRTAQLNFHASARQRPALTADDIRKMKEIIDATNHSD
jgi:hypothetical protein